MESPNPNEIGISFNDVMNRRLKSRERQRRYREKKRIRTDSSKLCGTQQSSQMQMIVLPTDVPVVEAVTRVHCKRDWKKDARRAHLHTVKQETMSNGIASTGLSLPGAEQLPNFHSGTSESEKPSNTENVRSKLGRRNWKAEARLKRN
ncbi:uncharacterized protein LOC141653826 [Silene latifolia]|uniref:uncharacterized protein LOC141653826 n=1 Tax=Silene latifolia TaxID=37657 RepID=UPI003D77AC9A